MSERRHQIAGARPADPAVGRNEIDIAQSLHQPRVRLLLGRDEERPVGGVGDVLAQVYRRMDAADDPAGALPGYRVGGNGSRIDHQPPRTASRWRRTRIRSVSSPPSITSSAR